MSKVFLQINNYYPAKMHAFVQLLGVGVLQIALHLERGNKE